MNTNEICLNRDISKYAKLSGSTTVDSELFMRTSFSLIFANSLPREFKVLADIENIHFFNFF